GQWRAHDEPGAIRLRKRLRRSLGNPGPDKGRSRVELRCGEGKGGRPRASLGPLPLGGRSDASEGRPDVAALGLLPGRTSSGCIWAAKGRRAIDEVLQERPQREVVVCGEVKAARCLSPGLSVGLSIRPGNLVGVARL